MIVKTKAYFSIYMDFYISISQDLQYNSWFLFSWNEIRERWGWSKVLAVNIEKCDAEFWSDFQH